MTLLASTLLICAGLYIGDFLRGVIRRNLPQTSLVSKLGTDFLVCLEQCLIGFEGATILQHHGEFPWSVVCFLSTVYQLYRWTDAVLPAPYMHLADWIADKKSLFEVILRSVVLQISAVCTYRLMKLIWSYEFLEIHVGRPELIDNCEFPWTDIAPEISFASEFAGTFVLFIVPGLIMDNPTLANNDPIYGNLLIAATVLGTVYSAFGVSGGFYNPMLASALFYGCSGQSFLRHVGVYWVGSTLGAVAAVKIYPPIKEYLYSDPKSKKKE